MEKGPKLTPENNVESLPELRSEQYPLDFFSRATACFACKEYMAEAMAQFLEIHPATILVRRTPLGDLCIRCENKDDNVALMEFLKKGFQGAYNELPANIGKF